MKLVIKIVPIMHGKSKIYISFGIYLSFQELNNFCQIIPLVISFAFLHYTTFLNVRTIGKNEKLHRFVYCFLIFS